MIKSTHAIDFNYMLYDNLFSIDNYIHLEFTMNIYSNILKYINDYNYLWLL